MRKSLGEPWWGGEWALAVLQGGQEQLTRLWVWGWCFHRKPVTALSTAYPMSET